MDEADHDAMQDPLVKARVSTLRSGFLAGGTKVYAEGAGGNAVRPHGGASAVPDEQQQTLRNPIIISALSQPPPDDTATKDVTFKGATVTHNAASYIGSKKFTEYSWSKPVRDPDVKARVKVRRRGMPAESRMLALSLENDRASKSLEIPRASPAGVARRAHASLIDVRGDMSIQRQVHHMHTSPRADSDAESPWLLESSTESIGMAPSLDGRMGESTDDHSFSDDPGYDSLGEAAESVVSIKDLLDRKREELSEVEAKYSDVKQGKVKPPKTERKKKVKEVPAVLVANALMQENLASELAVLKATLNVHSLTNQCGDHLHEIWGIGRVEPRRHAKSFVSDNSARHQEHAASLGTATPHAPFDMSSSMKVIKNEIRKVHALHEANLPKSHAPGHGLRLRSPRGDHEYDDLDRVKPKKRHGKVMAAKSFKSKRNFITADITIKGPKLVMLTAGYKYDFSGLIELCENISINTMLTSLDISNNQIQPDGVKKLLAPCLKSASQLLHLNLTRNDLRAPGMTALASALPFLSGLQSLVLANNNIGDQGATALAPPLLLFRDLELLDLESNCISIPGLKELQPSLKLAPQLKSLELSGNVTHFSHESSEGAGFMEVMMPALCELTNLTHLGLASNVLLTGAKVLARVLGDLRKALVSLDLGGRLHAHNRIGAAGMKTLSAGLFWTPLIVLDMSYNDLGVEGANSLALVLSIHTSLTEISLRGNGFGSVGARVLMGSLVKHQRIRNLNLADNDLNSEALTYISEGLVHFTALERLCLAHNMLVAASAKDFLNSSVSHDGIDLFIDSMLHSSLATQVHSLDLRQAGLDQHALRGMVDLVRTSSTLKVLNGLDFSQATEQKLPAKLDNYELLYVAQRLVEIEGGTDPAHSGRVPGAESLARQRRKVDVTEFTSIDLSFCDFLEFPGVLSRLRNLREIDLSGNHLLNIPMATMMNFASLHDIVLRDCPLILHPPRAVAAKGQVIEYLRECKLRADDVCLPLVAAGENDEVLAAFMAPILQQLEQAPLPEASTYRPQGTPREDCKGKALLPLPSEIRWAPEGVARKFSLIRVSGTARLVSCMPFIQVQRALNVYVVRATGSLDRAEVLAYLDLLNGEVLTSRSIVAPVIAHDGSVEEEDLTHRRELVNAIAEQWRNKLPSGGGKKCLDILESICINTSEPANYVDLGLKLQTASEVLIPREGDWVHPLVTRLEDTLASIALRGHFWITWKVYFAKLNALLDEYDSPVVCAPTITEVLHAKGVIRCVGPTRDLETFEKPVLDTVIINTYKAADLMSRMPGASKSWKEWQVVEYLRSVHKTQMAWTKGGRAAKALSKIRRLFSHSNVGAMSRSTSSGPEGTDPGDASGDDGAGVELVITTSARSIGELAEEGDTADMSNDNKAVDAARGGGAVACGDDAAAPSGEELAMLAAAAAAAEHAHIVELLAPDDDMVASLSLEESGGGGGGGGGSPRSPREASLTPVEEHSDQVEDDAGLQPRDAGPDD